MAWVLPCREPPYLTLSLTLDRKGAEHLLEASTSQSRQEFLYSLDRWENGSRTNDVTCPRWWGQTHRMQGLEGPQRACPKAPVMELHGGYILSLTRVKRPTDEVSTSTSPPVSGQPPKSPKPRALRPASCKAPGPSTTFCLGFSPAAKADPCCQNSALVLSGSHSQASLSSHCSRIAGHSKPSPTSADPNQAPLLSSRQWVWPHEIPRGPQTCHVLSCFGLRWPLLREGTSFLHLDLWQPRWSLKGLLTCLLLQEASLNMRVRNSLSFFKWL